MIYMITNIKFFIVLKRVIDPLVSPLSTGPLKVENKASYDVYHDT